LVISFSTTGVSLTDFPTRRSILKCNQGHETADALYTVAQTTGPPTLDNGLINGTNVYNDTGSRFETTFTAGQSYRMRLVNGAIDSHWKFQIDNHTMTVMAMDLVPIVPYNTTVLNIGIGQRYDIVVNADQTAGDYWMRSIPQTFCSSNDNTDNIKGIVRYDSTSTADPTTTAYTFTDDCDDESQSTDLVPYLALDAGAASITNDEVVTVGKVGNVFKWFMEATTFVSPWDNPTLLQVYNGNTTFNTSEHVVEIPTADEWMYFIISTTNTVPHPIHLHGHDFYVLAQGTGTYNSTTTLSMTNPPRRDVAMLPSAGYLVIAFPADNPGAWLMHCHIGWHTSDGLALQLLERETEIPALIDYATLNSTCAAWDAYMTTDDIVEDDSGV
jgi:FtsP/CotA-like multicopper oxidase with cupredoxin domain